MVSAPFHLAYASGCRFTSSSHGLSWCVECRILERSRRKTKKDRVADVRGNILQLQCGEDPAFGNFMTGGLIMPVAGAESAGTGIAFCRIFPAPKIGIFGPTCCSSSCCNLLRSIVNRLSTCSTCAIRLIRFLGISHHTISCLQILCPRKSESS